MIRISKIGICKDGTKQRLYTIRFAVFDPKKYFVGTDEAKDLCRRQMHCSKKKCYIYNP